MSYRHVEIDPDNETSSLDDPNAWLSMLPWNNIRHRPPARGWRVPRLPLTPLRWRDGRHGLPEWEGQTHFGIC
ncbi:MAG: hypothetical protein H7834_01100 [Magnetococcus sp. YQC-9]